MTETVRTEFDALLKSKDATIQDLQNKLEIAKTCQQESDEKAKILSDANADLKNKLLKLQSDANTKIGDLNAMLADKDKLNHALADLCDELKSKLENMQVERAAFDEMENG